ncbi:MAG: hypothetical protein AMJ69_09875 [Gammaproteobacteria bacterium SG8_47]|nr:MAG: hypothetical protein AMJ69_09875 [Gammaproteobacteria bacterium SG8_47]
MNVYLKNSQTYACVAVAVAFNLVVLVACSHSSDEEDLEIAIEALSAAVEDRDLGAFRDHLAPDFLGNATLDRRAVQQILLYHWRQYPQVRAQIVEHDIYVEGERARTTVLALVLGLDVLPKQGRLMEVEARWRKQDGTWRIHHAQWHDAIRRD